MAREALPCEGAPPSERSGERTRATLGSENASERSERAPKAEQKKATPEDAAIGGWLRLACKVKLLNI